MSHIVWVSTLIVDQDRVLLVHEKKEGRYNLINFPGGHLEPGETVIEGAKREAREEVQCEIELDGVLVIYSHAERKAEHFIFLGHIVNGNGEPNPSEVLDARWYTFDEVLAMPEGVFNSPGKIQEAIEKYRSGKIVPIDIIIEA